MVGAHLERPLPVPVDTGGWAGNGLDDELRFLWSDAWPHAEVEVVETHVSVVFLVDERAYKLKKPVRLPYLDYRGVESRHRDCVAEVELNQPLAPGVYLGVVPVVREPSGRFHLDGRGGPGEVVDWLVVMRRLHRADLLDQVLGRRTPDPAELDGLLDHLAGFYATTGAEAWPPARYRERLRVGLDLDAAGLRRHQDRFDGPDLDLLVARLEDAIGSTPGLDQRARRLVDGHGDLRPEHVALQPVPLVIDRVTFDRTLRLVDPLYDLALLAVELEQLGVETLGDAVIAGSQRRVPDPAPADVATLYRALRALTQARLSIAHLDDGGDDEHRARWTRKAVGYLVIADHHVARCPVSADRTGTFGPGPADRPT
jgi:uncharacterized protein